MKKLLFVFTLASLLLATFAFRSTQLKSETVSNPKVIAYYSGGESEIDAHSVEQLDQIIYSFLHLVGNKLTVETDAQDAAIRKLVSLKKQHPSLLVLISLGGWGGCETCSDVFSSPEDRKTFAKSVLKILKVYGADGIDLDWEYPAIEGHPGHAYKKKDRRHFTLLVKELRRVLGNQYQLSFAAGAHDDFLKNSVEWDSVMPLVDNVNLMTYDLVNGYSKITGHHAALFGTEKQALSANYSINYLKSIGVPLNKVVLGAAFYARIWEGVDSTNNGLYQEGTFKTAILYKDFGTYFNKNWELLWDEQANAPYAYNASEKLFATFDDVRSVEIKTKYVKQRKLKGIMFWELIQDNTMDKSNSLLDAIHRNK